ILVPERAWARRLEGMVQTTAFGPLCDEMLSRGEKIMTKLEGKVAVITGGNSGHGQALRLRGRVRLHHRSPATRTGCSRTADREERDRGSGGCLPARGS